MGACAGCISTFLPLLSTEPKRVECLFIMPSGRKPWNSQIMIIVWLKYLMLWNSCLSSCPSLVYCCSNTNNLVSWYPLPLSDWIPTKCHEVPDITITSPWAVADTSDDLQRQVGVLPSTSISPVSRRTKLKCLSKRTGIVAASSPTAV